jgi:hypothetical protein
MSNFGRNPRWLRNLNVCNTGSSWLSSLLFEDVFESTWFQHDGVSHYFPRRLCSRLGNNFPDRWIPRGGFIAWLARSPDVTPLIILFVGMFEGSGLRRSDWGGRYSKLQSWGVCSRGNFEHLLCTFSALISPRHKIRMCSKRGTLKWRLKNATVCLLANKETSLHVVLKITVSIL